MMADGPCVVCLVTDRGRLNPCTADDAVRLLLVLVEQAVQAGVDLVQIREHDLDGRRLCELTARAVALASGTSTRIVVNDRLDVALVAGASGVHLKERSYSAAAARRVAPRPFLIGRSVHDAPGVSAAAAGGALDYLIFGTVFPTRSKGTGVSASGPGGLAAAVRATGRPVLAIGGVTLASLADIARAGAAGFAAIGFFVDRDGEPAALTELVAEARRRFDSGRMGS